MRFLETSLLICELALLITFWIKPVRYHKYFRWSFFLPAILFLLHSAIEGIRWQLTAAYGIAILLAFVGMVYARWHLPKFAKVILSFIGILIVGVSFFLAYLLPVFHLPLPSGPFAVGKSSLYLQDSSRAEMITKDSTDKRALMLQIWYPAGQIDQATVAYIHPEAAKTVIQYFGLPGFISGHFNLIQTHAGQDVPVVTDKGKFPVVIFSPGHMTHSSIYTSLLETWASHGYIIFCIDYTYESPAVILPDGEVIYYDAAYTDVWQGASWNDVQASIEGFRQSQNDSVKLEHLQQYLEQMPFSARVNNWVKDVGFVIDQLHKADQLPSIALFDKMDLDRIAAAGHSVGGATSVVAAAKDARIKAVINMDGSQWGSFLGQKINQPFLWLTAQRDNLTNSTMDMDAFLYDQVTDSLHHFTITGATHANFYDLSLWSPYPPLTHTGTIDGNRMIHVINSTVLTFFDCYLKGKAVHLKGVPKRFNELHLVDHR